MSSTNLQTFDIAEDSPHHQESTPPPHYEHSDHGVSGEDVAARLESLHQVSTANSSVHHTLSTVPTSHSYEESHQQAQSSQQRPVLTDVKNPQAFMQLDGASTNSASSATSSQQIHHHNFHAHHHHSGHDANHDTFHPPPPAYSESGNYRELDIDDNGLNSKARINDDGRIDIRINQTSRKFQNLLTRQLSYLGQPTGHEPSTPIVEHFQGRNVPRLNIVVQIIGSRGDVQPFVALGRELRNNPPYHRIRIATHPTFKGFVEENGLEFFSIGGDPAELMAYMVKNPGLMPGMDSLKQGDVGKRRKAMYEMFVGCWRSCVEAGDGMGPEIAGNLEAVDPLHAEDIFIADAIIANPPSFAHIHCAERLAIPLHMMFTMPWTATQSFPHPLANITSSNTDANVTNFLTYTLVEMMTWQGLGDLVNRFREKYLGLDPISTMWAPGMISRLKVPQTYCWSPALIPKPADWGPHITISGFYFLDLAGAYTPPPDLAEFLEAGSPPVYIGFGSIVVDDPNALTNMIFEAVKKAGIRALVSKGWGGLGGDSLNIPDGVFMLGNCPHDWLFKRVSAVVHHGGAGTTAIGIALGKPTVVVPFFGDQPFWGSMVARAGAGPEPVAYKKLTADILAESIKTALTPEAQESGARIAAQIATEKGAATGAKSFHNSLDARALRCLVDQKRGAVWRVKRTEVRLSALAAATLVQEQMLEYTDLKLCRHQEWNTDEGPIEPISGGASALLGTIGSVMMSVGDFPKEIFKAAKHSGSHDHKNNPPPLETAQHVSEATIRREVTHDLTGPSAEDNVARRNSSSVTTGSHELAATPTISTVPSLESPSDSPHSITPRMSMERGRSNASIDSESGMKSPGTKSHRSLLGSLNHRSRSNSPSGKRSGSLSRRSSGQSINKLHKEKTDTELNHSTSQAGEISLDMLVGAGKGAGRIAQAVFKSPMDFTLSIAQGFHNAPKLYGDDTVRKQDKITGIQSGLKASGKSFGLGLYDGVTGLVTQPIKGAKEEGVGGFVKGFGKGVGGLILKPGAGFWGLTGYAFKGIHEEIQKLRGNNVTNYILTARTTQGILDLQKSTQAERDAIILRWKALGVERVKVKSKKKEAKAEAKAHRRLCPSSKDEASFAPPLESEAAREQEELEDAPENRFVPVNADAILEIPTRTNTSQMRNQVSVQSRSQVPHHGFDEEELENAITESVKQTSTGDVEQDAIIEQAIRASLADFAGSHVGFDEEELMDRALQASVVAHEYQQTEHTEDQVALRRVIEQSMHDYHATPHASELPDHDLDLQRALNDSKLHQHGATVSRETVSIEHHDTIKDDEDAEYRLALQKSQDEEAERLRKEVEEEEIVLNYVKRMSMAESQYSARRQNSGGNNSLASSIPTNTLERTQTQEEKEALELGEAIKASLMEQYKH